MGSKTKALLGLLASALAVVAALAPAAALAVTSTDIEQDMFDESGTCTITDAGYYTIDDDLVGTIVVSAPGGTVQVKMQGGSLTSGATHEGECLRVEAGKLIVTMGTLQQSNAAYPTVLSSSSELVSLVGTSLRSAGNSCVRSTGGVVELDGCDCITYAGSNATLATEPQGVIVTNAGSLANQAPSGAIASAEVAGSIRLYAGTTCPVLPEGAVPSDGCSLYLGESGTYVVGLTEDVKQQADWYVDNVGTLGTVYYESEADAKAAAQAHGSSAKSLSFSVTFDTDGGSTVGDATVHYGGTVSEPADEPSKAGFFFDGWYLDGAKFDFGTTLTSPVTLKAKWKSPVAEIGGVGYATLQDAVNAVQDGQTVKVLADTTNDVTVQGSKSFTIDLNGKTLSSDSGILYFMGSGTVTVKNGTVKNGDASSVPALGVLSGNVTAQDLKVSSSGGLAAEVAGGTLTIDGGEYYSKSRSAIASVAQGTLIVNSGKITSDYRDDYSAYVRDYATLKINGGDFSGAVDVKEYGDAEPTLVISGGTFDYIDNLDYLADDRYYLETADERCHVLTRDKAMERASHVVRVPWQQGFPFKDDIVIYFEDADEARSFHEFAVKELGEATIHEIFHVNFVSRHNLVEARHIEETEALGELPAGTQVAGYTFAGWYVDDKEVTADYVPTKSGDVVAMWTKDGSRTDPTTDPTDGSGSDDASDAKADPTATPQTGDAGTLAVGIAAAGSALAALGCARRRR